MTEHLVKTRDFIEGMELAQDAAGVEDRFRACEPVRLHLSVRRSQPVAPHTAVRRPVQHSRSAHAERVDAAIEWPKLRLSRPGRAAATTCACAVYLAGSLAS